MATITLLATLVAVTAAECAGGPLVVSACGGTVRGIVDLPGAVAAARVAGRRGAMRGVLGVDVVPVAAPVVIVGLTVEPVALAACSGREFMVKTRTSNNSGLDHINRCDVRRVNRRGVISNEG